MNRGNRSISFRSIPRSRTIDLDLPDGIRIVELSTGRLYVRTINNKTIIAGPSYLLYRGTRPIEIRSDSETTGRIIDIPLSDLDLIAVASTGLRIEELCDPEAGFRTIDADRVFLASAAGRFDLDMPTVGSLAYDRLRLNIGLLLIDLYARVSSVLQDLEVRITGHHPHVRRDDAVISAEQCPISSVSISSDSSSGRDERDRC